MTKEKLTKLKSLILSSQRIVQTYGCINVAGKSAEELVELDLHIGAAEVDLELARIAYDKALTEFTKQS